MKKTFFLALAVAWCAAAAAQKYSVIPQPQQMRPLGGDSVSLAAASVYAPTAEARRTAGFLPSFSLTDQAASAAVVLAFDPKLAIPAEGYRLVAQGGQVRIEASSESGLFYGVQTLLQLIERGKVPPVEAIDAPRFGWRGLMLDVSRHFFTKEEVLRYIDQMAAYKYNKFHWHLTDDQGWRIEIKAYPRLTDIGAWRAPRVGNWWLREPQRPGEAASYGGFYTQDDIRQVVAYAAARHVEVVPEIDVPGHSVAALVAYPELACLKAPSTVNVGQKFYGIDENSICAGNENSYKMLAVILGEVADLFPSTHFHIGGDECFKGFWKKCPKCTAKMQAQGLKNVEELQSYFIRRMESILKAKGKTLVGWDEIAEGGLAPSAVVMSWRGMKGGIAAAKAGHHVIMTPNNHCYIDLYQGEPTAEPDTYSMCRLSDSYAFEPIPEGVRPDLILGGQGNLWAESVPTYRHAEYMTWPRAFALAEVLWSPKEARNWDDFLGRVEAHFDRFDAADVAYARSVYNPVIKPFTTSKGEVFIELASELNGVEVYYTFDNTIPDRHTARYREPLSIPRNATTLKAVVVRDGRALGKVVSVSAEELRTRAKRTKREVGNLNLN